MNLTPTDRIVAALEGAGYKRLSPLQIAGLSFEFPAAFMGDERSLDLVLVADLAFDDARTLLQRVEGVARTLDVVSSKRPLTLVLAGPRPNREVLDAMSKVCRVLPISSAKSEDADTAVRNSLAVLMPLQVPNAASFALDPLGRVRKNASQVVPELLTLLPVAHKSADAVRKALHKTLSSTISSGSGKRP